MSTSRALTPAAPNSQYQHRLAWWTAGADPGGLPLPVVTLAEKSLVSVDISGAARYRLLESTRVYASQKLVQAGEERQIALRHCEHLTYALHKFNPVRLAYIRDRAAAHFSRDPARLDSLRGLRILDIGCGGGILSEPLARLGASVTGADPSESNIAAARRHAEESGLAVDYRCTSAEALAEAGETFDVVLAM